MIKQRDVINHALNELFLDDIDSGLNEKELIAKITIDLNLPSEKICKKFIETLVTAKELERNKDSVKLSYKRKYEIVLDNLKHYAKLRNEEKQQFTNQMNQLKTQLEEINTNNENNNNETITNLQNEITRLNESITTNTTNTQTTLAASEATIKGLNETITTLNNKITEQTKDYEERINNYNKFGIPVKSIQIVNKTQDQQPTPIYEPNKGVSKYWVVLTIILMLAIFYIYTRFT